MCAVGRHSFKGQRRNFCSCRSIVLNKSKLLGLNKNKLYHLLPNNSLLKQLLASHFQGIALCDTISEVLFATHFQGINCSLRPNFRECSLRPTFRMCPLREKLMKSSSGKALCEATSGFYNFRECSMRNNLRILFLE